MNPAEAQKILDKIIEQIFGYKNPYSLEQFLQKFAFDVRLPIKVSDSSTGEDTWAQSVNPTKFITMKNAFKGNPLNGREDWELTGRPIETLEDVLAAWNEINFTTTERQIESLNIAESDNIYNSENVYRSQDIHQSKFVLFSDSAQRLEYVVAVQRSNSVTYSARVEDSKGVSGSFSISWSGKITNSMFIHDSADLYECLFCSHLKSRQYCIANVQLDEKKYFQLKEQIVKWVLST